MNQQSIVSNTDYSLMSSAFVESKLLPSQHKVVKQPSLSRSTNDSFLVKDQTKTAKIASPKPIAKEPSVPLIGTALIALASVGVGGGVMFLGAKRFNWFGLGEKAPSTVTETMPKALKQALGLNETATNEEAINAVNSLNVKLVKLSLEDVISTPLIELKSQSLEELKRLANEGNNAESQFKLGSMYHYGRQGVQKKLTEAFEWYQKAANQNHAGAQCSVGYCYALGKGVRKNKEVAVEWYQKSAEQGNATAQYNLGVCYGFGKGVRKNKEVAVEWYKKSAEQGNARAQGNLAYCYYWGEGVKKNREQAKSWYQKAADQDDEVAIRALKDMEKKFSWLGF